MRISDWSSDVCSSDLVLFAEQRVRLGDLEGKVNGLAELQAVAADFSPEYVAAFCDIPPARIRLLAREISEARTAAIYGRIGLCTQRFGSLASWLTDAIAILTGNMGKPGRSEEHTSELQSLMRNSYAVFCLKKKK